MHQSEILNIESTLLALRKIAEQGLQQVKQLKAALPTQTQKKKRRPSVKYTSLILSGARATKKNTK